MLAAQAQVNHTVLTHNGGRPQPTPGFIRGPQSGTLTGPCGHAIRGCGNAPTQ